MRRWARSVLLVGCAAAGVAASGGDPGLSLAGTWRFALDPNDVGVAQRWFARELADTVQLPGTTDENHRGVFQDERRADRLSRPWTWKGPAWYQRDVTIPAAWRGRHVTLRLERTKHTRVWVDETFCAWENTLSTAQVFDVTQTMTPGRHRLTVQVDNARLPPVGPAHAVDERTQTNWNGIVGLLELRAVDPVWIEDVQVYPNAAAKQAAVRVTVGNITDREARGRLTVRCRSVNVETSVRFKTQVVALRTAGRRRTLNFVYEPGGDVPLWDEFHPALLRLDLDLETAAGGRGYRDRRALPFGMRDFRRAGNRLEINGRRVFLRGRTDCCFYPLTGYPPMDKAGWRRVLSILKAWGFNHSRFHSWCPPEAAFAAADELGFYFQAELPNKRSAFNAPEDPNAALGNLGRLDAPGTETEVSLTDYALREGERILRDFGQHPSFVLFTLGNELGRRQAMFDLVAHFKRIDPRHLYAQGSNNLHWNPSLAPGDDVWVTCKTGQSLPVRGSFAHNSFPHPHIESGPPGTLVDYGQSIRGLPVPVIAHETGQFQVYPDYRDIPKFTGVVRGRNYEIAREGLREAGMLDQAGDFLRASGALAAICYREDIEAALRTPDLGGFQLLDIQDFPGQGTALVGMLNVFMESKGILDAAAWRQFCCETVPLLRLERYVWTAAETLRGRVQVAHYGPAAIPEAQVTWTVTDRHGTTLASQACDRVTIPQGEVYEVGTLTLPLGTLEVPQRVTVTLAIEGTPYRNSYPIWVYPETVDNRVPADLRVTRSLAAAGIQSYLAAGGKVLLLPELDALAHSVPGAFQSDFWSPMFAASARRHGAEEPPGTLGILCDPNAPALAEFPTAFHSDWQWWHLVKHARPLILDAAPAGYRPIVQVVDNIARQHKLGLICETRVGPGKLLVCAIDLLGQQDRPEARQLLHSLLRYAGSEAFAPEATLDAALLATLLP